MSQLTERIDRFPRHSDLLIIMHGWLNKEFWSEVYKSIVMKHYSGRGPWMKLYIGVAGFMVDVVSLPSRLTTRFFLGKHSYGWILYISCAFLITVINLESDIYAVWEFVKAFGLTIWGVFSTQETDWDFLSNLWIPRSMPMAYFQVWFYIIGLAQLIFLYFPKLRDQSNPRSRGHSIFHLLLAKQIPVLKRAFWEVIYEPCLNAVAAYLLIVYFDELTLGIFLAFSALCSLVPSALDYGQKEATL